jgi:hypothetical protein
MSVTAVQSVSFSPSISPIKNNLRLADLYPKNLELEDSSPLLENIKLLKVEKSYPLFEEEKKMSHRPKPISPCFALKRSLPLTSFQIPTSIEQENISPVKMPKTPKTPNKFTRREGNPIRPGSEIGVKKLSRSLFGQSENLMRRAMKADKSASCLKESKDSEKNSGKVFLEKAHRVLDQNKFNFSDHSFELTTQVGKGDFSEVFDIASDSFILHKIVFKRFKKEVLSRYKDQTLNLLKHSLDQYHILLKHDFPVAPILNVATAIEDGYVLMEKIPNDFPQIYWNIGTPVSALSDETKSYLKQVKNMFQQAFDLKIQADIYPRNLKMTQNGNILLVDLKESTDIDSIDENPLQIELGSQLRAFANNNPHIYNYLLPLGAIHPIEQEVKQAEDTNEGSLYYVNSLASADEWLLLDGQDVYRSHL